MNVTRFTDYSMRVLIYLAVNNNALATIKEIAQCYGISKNHLMKVVQDLNHKNYVIAIRGKNGGLKLARDPIDINIGEVIRSIEQGSQLVECFGENNVCIITPTCQLKTILADALEQFFLKLDEYTLADLIFEQESEILNLLSIRDL